MPDYEAGRELDALIAEKVMGWCWSSNDSKSVLAHTPSWLLSPNTKLAEMKSAISGSWEMLNYTYIVPPTLPHYSTDIADAWEVVEKLNLFNRRALYFDSEYMQEWEIDEIREIDCGEMTDDCLRNQIATAPTPALAICRAALKIAEMTPLRQ